MAEHRPTPEQSAALGALVRDLAGHLQWLSEAGADDLPPLRANTPAAMPTPPTSTRSTNRGAARSGPVGGATAPSGADAAAAPSGADAAAAPSGADAAAAPTSADAAAVALPIAAGDTLEAVRATLGECTRCRLHATRTHLVYGTGNPRAELVFVGEGPGADEDQQGEPFVGRAGQLLDKMILAMGLTRSEVYICNVVKCRPPENRNPEADEMETCLPFLRAQLRAIGPKVIVVLGKTAAQALLDDKTPITRLRGRWRELGGAAVMPTFHPAYLLRSPGEKGKAWEDLKAVVARLGRTLPAKG